MPDFELGATVAENVIALRRALGSATRMLSRDDLAAMINERHKTRTLNGSTLQRFEEGVEPDFESVRIMASLAGVSFEEFALGVRRSTGIIDPSRDRKLTDDEVQRASTQAARDRARSATSARKRGNQGR